MCDAYIQQVLDGDTDAFRFIIQQYKDDAWSLAISVVKEEFIAQDVVQNAFVKAYTKLDTFKRRSTFSTWLYRIVINEAFAQQRKQKRKSEITGDISPAGKPSKVSHTILKMEEDNQRYYINEALKKLPANYSLALRLFYLQDYSIGEITQVTGWSDSNTKVILHRARNKMKTLLTDLFNVDKEELY